MKPSELIDAIFDTIVALIVVFVFMVWVYAMIKDLIGD